MTIIECQSRANEIYRKLLDAGHEPDDVLLGIPGIRVSQGCASVDEAKVATRDVRHQITRLAAVGIYGEGAEADRFCEDARARLDAMPY